MRRKLLFSVITALVFAAPAGATASSSAGSSGDLCEDIGERTCAEKPESADGRFIDETGFAQHFDTKREVRRLLENHRLKIKEAVTRFLAAQNKTGIDIYIEAFIPLKIQGCRGPAAVKSKAIASCKRSLLQALGELLQYELSGGEVVSPKKKKALLAVAANLVKDNGYQTLLSEVRQAIVSGSDPHLNAKMQDEIFPDIKRRIGGVVRDLLPPSAERDEIERLVNRVKYGGDQCKPLLFGKPGLPSIAHAGAFFEIGRESDLVKVCRGFFGTNTSLYPLYNTVAHEIAHSIDPCRLGQLKPETTTAATLIERDQRSVWSELIKCLRSEQSIGARNLDERFEMAYCYNDQINEAFADFMATEVMGQLIKEKRLAASSQSELRLRGIGNIWRYTCRGPQLGGSDPHATPAYRMNRLTAVHPVIRQSIGCPAKPTKLLYCGKAN